MKQEMGVVKSRDLQPACETEREARLWLRWSQSEARTRSGWRSIRRERRCLHQHAALTKHVVESVQAKKKKAPLLWSISVLTATILEPVRDYKGIDSKLFLECVYTEKWLLVQTRRHTHTCPFKGNEEGRLLCSEKQVFFKLPLHHISETNTLLLLHCIYSISLLSYFADHILQQSPEAHS